MFQSKPHFYYRLKIPYLATSVWVANNPYFANINQYPNPIQKKDIHTQKIENFKIVVESVKDTIDELNKAVSMGMDPGNVRVWLHAKVKTTFMDRNYKGKLIYFDWQLMLTRR